LSLAIAGAKAGRWFDHETSEGGDLLELIRRERGGSFSDAIAYSESFIGTIPNESAAPGSRAQRCEPGADTPHSKNQQRAIVLWGETEPIAASTAEHYLISRGIRELPRRTEEVLRFHRWCPFGSARHPAMVGLMVDVRTNEPKAIHRTALTAEGKKIGLMTLRPKVGAAIKLSPDDVVELGLTIGEGIETTISAMA
jgi:hypothetical protein